MSAGPDVQILATAISTNASNDRKIFLRYPKAFSPAFDRASQPVRVIGTNQNSSHVAKKRLACSHVAKYSIS
jgi:hypothetical protein